MAKKRSKDFNNLPNKEDVLKFVADNPGKASKREIAKAFGIKGADRIGLKRLLAELSEEGLLKRRRKKLQRPDDTPDVMVLSIIGRNTEGELLASPETWDAANDGAKPTVLIASSSRSTGPLPSLSDRILTKLTLLDSDEIDQPDEQTPTHTGKVIRILDKDVGPIMGILAEYNDGRPRLLPISKKQRELIVHAGDAAKAKVGDLVSVKIEKAGRYGQPVARILNVIGDMTNEKAVSAIALHAHGIPHIFPSPVLDQANAAENAVFKDREDWTELPLITIDPADAKDHDDAVFAQRDDDPQNEGGHIVTVAIADVSWYVRPDTPLDKEALLRGNSVYFPDRVVPMLPERISNDLCSLREGVNRPALAVKLKFDKSGSKLKHTFHRVMMHSKARLSYKQAQDAADGTEDEVSTFIRRDVLGPLWEAYKTVQIGRNKRAPLELNLPERKIILKEDGTVDRVLIPDRLEAHKLIEEFMIQANVAAAESLEAKNTALIYRVHEPPSLEKLESLREFLRSLKVSLARGGNLRPHHFNDILERVEDSEHQEVVNQVVLRSQSQAEYSPDNVGHFGLNLRRYAHFTSPIRRYADLMVHRALVTALGLGEGGLPNGYEKNLGQIAADISVTERRAMLAERDTKDRLIAAHLSEQIGARFFGKISGVTKVGLFVKLADTGADGFIPASKLGWDYFIHDEEQHSLVGEKTGERYRIGDEVEVKLVEAAPVAGALRFEMLSKGTKGKPPKRSGRQAKHRRKRQKRAI